MKRRVGFAKETCFGSISDRWPAPPQRSVILGVVVQSDLFNSSRIATSVVWLITSNSSRANAPGNVALRKGDANLPKASVVNVSQVLTIDKSELVERIGRLPAETVDAIRKGLDLLFDRV